MGGILNFYRESPSFAKATEGRAEKTMAVFEFSHLRVFAMGLESKFRVHDGQDGSSL